MAATIKCQWCGQHVSVGEGSPKVLTCPTCLAKIRNPVLNPMPPAERETLARPVIPLEEQVHADHRAASAIVLLICVVVAVGTTMLFMSGVNLGALAIGAVIVSTILAIVLSMRIHGADPAHQREFAQTLNSISRALSAIFATFLIIGGIVLLLAIGTCAAILKGW
jgi:hypothetical protein